MNRIFVLVFAAVLTFATSTQAQDLTESLVPALDYPKAKVTETAVAEVDIGRRIQRFDAAPDGSNWLVVDKFGQMESIILNGARFPQEYNTTPVTTARVSPNGKYMIWLGLTRAFTDDGFNATLATLYKGKDSIIAFTSDYQKLYFSNDGKEWAVTFPYANEKQTQDRNALVLNGKPVVINGAMPRDFVFGPNGWYYRTNDDTKEYLTTSTGTVVLRDRKAGLGAAQHFDSVVLHYASHQRFNDAESRATDFEIEGTIARQLRTSYRQQDQANALVFMVTGERGQIPTRWITNVMTDTAGKTMAYFACDPAQNNKFSDRDERPGIVVYDGKKYDGPFPTVERLFLSKSGKNIAYSVGGAPRIILNKKELGPVGMISSAAWSSDEKYFAYATSNNRGKIQVVVDGKVSPSYEHVGKIGWTNDGKFVEYMAVNNGKVLKIRQAR